MTGDGIPVWVEVLVTVGGAVITMVVWLIRLEGRVTVNEKKHDAYRETTDEKLKSQREYLQALESKHTALAQRIWDKLSSMERSLAKIEGRLSIEDQNN